MSNQSEIKKALNRILKIIREIVEKSADGNYIYRGEPEHYEENNGKVSSALYRISPEGFDSGEYNLERFQEADLKDARNYIHEHEKEDFELLTELQHYGSQTNLIDFTTDYHIALFFACSGSYDKDGRVILLQRTEEIDKKYRIKRPWNPPNRVVAQKSIFTQPPQGFIDASDLIALNVPANLKQWILIHLRNFQDISAQSIYNDLHGFIRHKDLRHSREAMLPLVFAKRVLEDIVDESQTDEERQEAFQKAIQNYTERLQYAPYEVKTYVDQGRCYLKAKQLDRAIETFSKAILLKPSHVKVYFWRGSTYFKKSEFDRAIEDFSKVINCKPDYVDAYFYRGLAFYFKKDMDFARKDFDKTRELKPDYFTEFDQRFGFKPPEDLASMLVFLTD